MSFSLIIEHLPQGIQWWKWQKGRFPPLRSSPSSRWQTLNHSWHRCYESVWQGRTVQPSWIRALSVDFGKFIEISKAKGKAERKFGRWRGRSMYRKDCGMFHDQKEAHSSTTVQREGKRMAWDEAGKPEGSLLRAPIPFALWYPQSGSSYLC